MKKKYFFIFFLVAIFLGAVSLYTRLNQQLPAVTTLGALKNKVSGRLDKNGIYHLYAQNEKDLYRTFGYVMASERLLQMDLQRHAFQGRLSEVFGSSTVNFDKQMRSLMLPVFVDTHWNEWQAKYPQEFWQNLEDYYAGINDFIKTGNLPLEYLFLPNAPAPFSSKDAFGFIGMMGLSFSNALKIRPTWEKLNTLLPAQVLGLLRDEDFRAYSLEGSNGWVLSGARSSSGKPILANDPHIGFSQPGVWFKAQLETADFKLLGHFLPLIPFAAVGRTPHHAWGLTMSLVHDVDLYKEMISPDEKKIMYRGVWRDFKMQEDVIKVRFAKDVKIKIGMTPHGPLMRETLNENISLKWTFFLPENSTMLGFYKMARAQNHQEFAAAVALGTAPGMNVLYADEQNNIGLWHFGKIPRMSDNRHRDSFLDGASGAHEYLNYQEFKHIPFQLNPKSGVIVSANWRPSKEFLDKKILGDWMPRDRFMTIEKKLSEKKVWSIEELKVLQTIPYNDFYPQIVASLAKVLPEIGEKFKNWDFKSTAESHHAYLFHRFIGHLGLAWFKSQVQNAEMASKICGNASSWDSFREALLNIKVPLDLIKASWEQIPLLENENKSWGDWHRLTLEHPLGKIPLFSFYNVGPVGVMGGHDQVNQMREESWCESGKIKSGPSLRFLVDLSEEKKSWGILPSGNSGHLWSPYYKNQWNDFIRGNYLIDHFYAEGDWNGDEARLLEWVPAGK